MTQTAMQQMIDFINDINDNDRSEFNYYYDYIMEKLNELVEIEKQQMSSQIISDDEITNSDIKTEEHNYLPGFINQFEEEISNDDWTVSRFLEWLKLNNFKIVKNQMASSQTEISDEEIEKGAENAWSDYEYDEGNLYSTTFKGGWKLAIEWYREQVKQRQ